MSNQIQEERYYNLIKNILSVKREKMNDIICRKEIGCYYEAKNAKARESKFSPEWECRMASQRTFDGENQGDAQQSSETRDPRIPDESRVGISADSGNPSSDLWERRKVAHARNSAPRRLALQHNSAGGNYHPDQSKTTPEASTAQTQGHVPERKITTNIRKIPALAEGKKWNQGEVIDRIMTAAGKTDSCFNTEKRSDRNIRKKRRNDAWDNIDMTENKIKDIKWKLWMG